MNIHITKCCSQRKLTYYMVSMCTSTAKYLWSIITVQKHHYQVQVQRRKITRAEVIIIIQIQIHLLHQLRYVNDAFIISLFRCIRFVHLDFLLLFWYFILLLALIKLLFVILFNLCSFGLSFWSFKLLFAYLLCSCCSFSFHHFVYRISHS